MKPLPPDQIFSNSASREISPSSPSDFHPLLSSEISSRVCPAQNIIFLPPNPLVTSRSPDDSDSQSLKKWPTSAKKKDPPHPKTSKHRRRTLCFTPHPKRNQAALTRSLRGKLESLEASLEALAEAQRKTEDSEISLINDLKCSNKNELRTFVIGKTESLNNMINKLNEKIVSLEKSNSRLIKRKPFAKNSAWYPAIWDFLKRRRRRRKDYSPTHDTHSL